MMSLFPGQIARLRSGERGQAALLLVTTVAVILSLIFATVRFCHLGSEKVGIANAVDSIALSAATWEARGLNIIATLNNGILQCLGAIRWICAIWAALAISALFGGWPAFAAYSKRAPRLIRSYWKCARQFSEWADTIRKAVPYLVIAETATLSRKQGIVGSLYPFNPAGRHDAETTLELHVKPGPPLTLADAFGPLSRVRNYSHKKKWIAKILRRVLGVLDGATSSLLRNSGGPVRLLVPEDDFPRRQKIRFAGGKTAETLPVPMADWIGKVRFASEATAEPHGGDAAAMTWKSRLTDERKHP